MTDMFSGLHDEIARLHQVNMELEEENSSLAQYLKAETDRCEDIINTIRDKEWDARQEYVCRERERRLKEVKMNVLQDLMFELGIEPRKDDE